MSFKQQDVITHSNPSRFPDAFSLKLGECSKKLVENYSNLLESAKITDQIQNVSETMLLQTSSTNIILECETLLSMITELKHIILLNDFDTLNEIQEGNTNRLNAFLDIVGPQITHFRRDIGDFLHETEFML